MVTRLTHWLLLLSAAVHARSLCISAIQRIGTHNSYHRPAPVKVTEFLDSPLIQPIRNSLGVGSIDQWKTNMPRVDVQLNNGVGQLELDLYNDPDGGQYRYSGALKALGGETLLPEPEWMVPGIKVFHIPDVDFNTNCVLLADCLAQLRNFSDTHTNHLPIVVHLELKGRSNSVRRLLEQPGVAQIVQPLFNLLYQSPTEPRNMTEVLSWDPGAMQELLEQLQEVFGEDDKLITPAMASSTAAVRAATADVMTGSCALPALDNLLGKFAFVLIKVPDAEEMRTWYLQQVQAGLLEPLLFLEHGIAGFRAESALPTDLVFAALNAARGTQEGGNSTDTVFSEPSALAQFWQRWAAALADVSRFTGSNVLVRGRVGNLTNGTRLQAAVDAGIHFLVAEAAPLSRSQPLLPDAPPNCHTRCNMEVLLGNATLLQLCTQLLAQYC